VGVYKGPEGSISFFSNGSYELASGFGAGEHIERGKYVFFSLGAEELLELRPEEPQEGKSPVRLSRETFRVNRTESEDAVVLTLTRVQMGTRGMQELHEAPISLTKS
jgi:hypothetical protein